MKINLTDALNAMAADAVTLEPATVAVLVSTQYMENYGAHDWDGRGECPQYWKCKGGSEYLVTGVPAHYGDSAADLVLMTMDSRFEHSSDYSREYVIGARVVAEDFDPAAHVDPATDYYGEAEWLRSSLERIAFPG